MKKQTLILIVLLLQLSIYVSAQDIEIVKQSAFQKEKKVKTFDFIESLTDTLGMTFVATIKVTGTDKKADLNAIYFKLKDKARDLGANSFKYISYQKTDSIKTAVMLADVYYSSDSALERNAQSQEKNTVYIFGDIVPSDKTISVKVNGDKKEVKGGTYLKYVNAKEGDEVKVNKGGFTGATIWLVWKENKASSYLSLTGFGLGGGPVPAGQIGMSFNTGRINQVESGLGRVLVLLMKESF